MLTFYAENWWVYVMRGALALLFGLMALFWPGLTLDLLILVFGLYAIVEGIIGDHRRVFAPAPGKLLVAASR